MNRDKIAIFDFDGTLTRHDTFISFAKFAMGNRHFYLSFLKSIPWLVLWKLGVITNGNAKQKLFQFLYKGMLYNDFVDLARRFSSQIDKDLNPSGLNYLKEHLKLNHKVYIVSASMYEWILPWAETNGIYKVIATKIDTDCNGRLTGHFATPNCHGKEKVRRACDEIPNFTDAESWAYGDSKSDEFILNASNHPLFI